MPTNSTPQTNRRKANHRFAHCSETQWIYYSKFINSVLRTIRQGKYDYCYFIFQIIDLLKYEHDNLKVEWLPDYQCFRVSLNKY